MYTLIRCVDVNKLFPFTIVWEIGIRIQGKASMPMSPSTVFDSWVS